MQGLEVLDRLGRCWSEGNKWSEAGGGGHVRGGSQNGIVAFSFHTVPRLKMQLETQKL